MVSVSCDYSEDTFMKTIHSDRSEEKRNDSILNITEDKCDDYNSKFEEETFHRSKELIKDEFLNVRDKRNICEESSSEFKNKEPQSIIKKKNIILLFTKNFMDIYITTKKRMNLLSNFFQPLFNFLQPKSNRKFVKFVGLAMMFFFMIVQSRKSGLQHNYETLRLFSQYSLVKDFHHGELSLLQDEFQLSDMTFVLYYAPWDRDSQDLKYHFLKAAAYHHDQISFVAINCWLPGSECKAHYKLQHFPILVLHIRVAASDETLNIPYNGPLNSHHIIRFLSLALRPYTHVSSQADVLAMQLDYQVIVLGYFEIGKDIHDFLIFYYSALSKLQFTHMREVAYGIITNPILAKIFSFAHVSSIHLILWNTTINYPNQIEKNVRNITQFVDLHLSQVTNWININGRKSSSLNNFLADGPFLMIITQDNPYHSTNDLFRILRSVALEYNNCHNSSLLLWLSKHLNVRSRANVRASDQICRQYLKSNLQYQSTIRDPFIDGLHEDKNYQMVELNFNDQSCLMEKPNFLQTTWNNLLTYLDKQPSMFSNCLKSGKLSPDSCQNCSCKTNCEVEMNRLLEAEENKETNKYSSLEDFGGPYEDDIINTLNNWLSEEHCKKLALGSALSPPPIIKEENNSLTIPGLKCKTNQTLKFVALDSLLHEDFSTHLGINFSMNIPKYTGAVIIDPVVEERYILDQPISRGSLVSFIYNFTYNQLTRSKISHGSGGIYFEDCDESQLCITNLNANNYEATTHQLGQTYVVLHYTHNCGACSAISHMLLSCMHITTDVSSLKFAKIDNSINTLPWHLTFDVVPAIVMYPAWKKSESRVLDITSPITIQLLMVLISYGLTPSDRLKLAMKVCDWKCQQSTTFRSASKIRRIQLSINDIYYRYQRYISLLVATKEELTSNKTATFLKYKYDLLLNLKHIQNYKLKHLRNKIKHLIALSSLYPIVPFNFSTLLSYETYLLSQSRKLS